MLNIPFIIKQLNRFRGHSLDDIGRVLGINSSLIGAHSLYSTISNAMLEQAGINSVELKKNHQTVVKAVRLKEKGVPKESMSFEQIRFMEVAEEEWDTSFLKRKFSTTSFFFVVFQYVGDTLYFKGAKWWTMPEELIETELHQFWSTLRSILREGVQLKPKMVGEKVFIENNLPGQAETKMMHVRPKASNAKDVTDLPDGQLITKQAYWFNNSFVYEILKDIPTLDLDQLTNKKSESNFNFLELKSHLQEPLYLISQVASIATSIDEQFTEFDLKEEKLNEIGYSIKPPFILSVKYSSVDEYLEEVIFAGRYFTLPKDPIWQTAFIGRKLENLENDYRLFYIADNEYLTITAIQQANISKELFEDFVKQAEVFVKRGSYFTMASLRKAGFEHELFYLGFEQSFYESLLNRPGRIKGVKLGGVQLFVKAASASASDLISNLLMQYTNISLDEFISMFEETFLVEIPYTKLNSSLKGYKDNPYYSEQLQMLFHTKEHYLNYISRG
ncbi:hypothetical protein [Bacillus sp. JJ722]|uniref:hypothetical protein n=1 Tax=Bacillus sp. JJ722 TaxID=3122973 RepID=UPI002FFE4A66